MKTNIKDEELKKRSEETVSRNEHLPISKFKKKQLDKVKKLYKQIKGVLYDSRNGK